jgi:hypothetical protein
MIHKTAEKGLFFAEASGVNGPYCADEDEAYEAFLIQEEYEPDRVVLIDKVDDAGLSVTVVWEGIGVYNEDE